MTRSLTVFAVCLVMSTGGTGKKAERAAADVDALSVVVDRLVEDMTSLQAQVRLLQTKVESQKITFTVSIAEASPGARHVQASDGSIVPFSHIITNTGGGFKESVNAFEAPVDGDYMFYVRVDISADYRAVVLKRNGQDVIWCHNDGNMRFITCGAVASLHAGDSVTVVQASTAGAIDAGLESVFSGFRIN